MIFNYSRKYKFSTQVSLENENIETVKEAKLLGTIITDDLKWNKNTAAIVKKKPMEGCNYLTKKQILQTIQMI